MLLQQLFEKITDCIEGDGSGTKRRNPRTFKAIDYSANTLKPPKIVLKLRRFNRASVQPGQ